jgi:branched-chain amino acid transport system permease protein
MRLDRRALVALILLAAFAALPLVATATGQEFYVGQFRRIMIFAIAAISLDLILGYGGMVSLGHAAFVGVGAYVVGVLHWHADRELLLFGFIPGTTSPFVTFPLAMAIAGLLAALIGLVSLRTTGLYFIMITLAFAQMLYFLFVSWRFVDGEREYGGDDGLRFPATLEPFGVDLAGELPFYYLVFAILALVLWLGRRVTESRFGLLLQGCRENERRMRALGFPTFRYKLAAFALAGAIAGLAGALMALHESYISPAIMHWTRSGDLVVMVVMGGMGTLVGPAAGATLFVLMEKFLPDWTEHWMLIFGPMVILIVLLARHGLLGLVERRRG